MINYINKIVQGDALTVLKHLQDESINTCVTSPPYWGLRDYGVKEQIGLEKTFDKYLTKMLGVFEEIGRVLKDDGTLWINMGDSYSGSGKGAWKNKTSQKETYIPDKKTKVVDQLPPKNLLGQPWRLVFALQKDGWILRSDIIWHKPNCMPESVKDRPTKAHEYVFLLTKNPKYYYDREAIKEACVNGDPNPPRGSSGVIGSENAGRRSKGNRKTFRGGGEYTKNQSFYNSTSAENDSRGNKLNELGLRNKRTVWTIATQPIKEAHFATFPEKLIKPCILAGCPVDGIVLDPFMGAGTTALVSKKLKRNFIGIELNPDYIKIAEKRIREVQ